MAKNDDLVAMGLTPQEIAYVNTMSSAGGISAGAGGIAMQMQNNKIARNNIIKEVLAKKGVTSGVGTGSASNQSSSQEQFSGIADQEVFGDIKSKLRGMIAGTDVAQNLATQQKQQSIGKYDELLSQYTKQGAFTDAAALVQSNLNASMEANKPAIQRAIEGSGTSAGSMQALLSQQLADKAALSAGSLGAQQAVSYGQIAAFLAGGRGNLTTGKDDSITGMAQLADLLKVSTGKSSSSGMSNFSPSQMLAGGAGTIRSTTGPTVQDTVAGTGIAGGGDLATQQNAYWASVDAADAAKKKKNDADFAFGTVNSGYNPYNSYVNI